MNPPPLNPIIPEHIRLLAAIQRRQLAMPLLLFVAGHRPLAFLTGQALHLTAPLGLLLGWNEITGWAEWLSAPDAAEQLEAALNTTA
jgi:hypothetical protein